MTTHGDSQAGIPAERWSTNDVAEGNAKQRGPLGCDCPYDPERELG